MDGPEQPDHLFTPADLVRWAGHRADALGITREEIARTAERVLSRKADGMSLGEAFQSIADQHRVLHQTREARVVDIVHSLVLQWLRMDAPAPRPRSKSAHLKTTSRERVPEELLRATKLQPVGPAPKKGSS
jgi:uncharacterized protein YoaH (UPF0181 family)